MASSWVEVAADARDAAPESRRRRVGFGVVPRDDPVSYSGRRPPPGNRQYVDRVNRAGSAARRYGAEALVILVALEASIEVTVRRDAPDAPRTALAFLIPAIVITVAPLLTRRRFAFAAPAAFWLLAAAVSFVDGRLVPFVFSVFVAGMAAAFLLGNQRDPGQARLGLAIVVGAAAIVVYNKPDGGPGTYVFIPLLFLLCWLGGFAGRDRARQAEAPESRAPPAGGGAHPPGPVPGGGGGGRVPRG